ncbi:uncharacterized protein LOC104884063 [Beta vulgaris subsp. vulgaris]|uniref:uncharacterized protein LOC104884063 n=1 Tax=Beta vulgaris subsp. vulgaris TaxID=3555 RepID=UPI0020372BBA|nr:uncharacterized protein LOC104884063 [Beta vulgaris subsp. vulgaris]
MGDEAPPKSLREYAMPDETTTTITRPTTVATHFELKPQFIQFISQDSYAGTPNESPTDHLANFLEKCNTLKLTNVSDDLIRYCAFPFSLRDEAKEWFKEEEVRQIATWPELKKAFLYKFFPPMRTSKFRNRDICYIDAASGGTFMAKTPEAAKTLLDDMAANNYLNDWSVSRGAPKKGAKVDQLSRGPVAPVCKICEVQGHSFNECQYNTMGVGTAQVNALLNTNIRPQNNPYSNTYNPDWNNHPNFSYKNNQPQPPHTNYSQPPGLQQRPPFNPSSSSSRPNLETIMENLASSQAKQVEYQAKQNEFFNNSLQQITAHNKLMESQMTQLAQQISHLSKPSGQLPGQTEPNPKGHINAISLRSDKELQEPTRRVTEQKNTAKEVIKLSEEVQGKTGLEDEAKNTEKEEPTVIPMEPYKPHVPFPQRLAQAKIEKKYGKFLDILKKLHINIPFLDAISEMPSYAKFLKDMLSNKRKIKENVTISLTAECSAILQNKLPKKLGDSGSYSIPIKLGDIEIKNALCDLGASVSLMPLSICKKLNMGELKPTRISLQLADRTIKFPLGILEDVPLRVRKFFIPCDFVVMEMEEDANVPIILGRPFLATAEAIIDMKREKSPLK